MKSHNKLQRCDQSIAFWTQHWQTRMQRPFSQIRRYEWSHADWLPARQHQEKVPLYYKGIKGGLARCCCSSGSWWSNVRAAAAKASRLCQQHVNGCNCRHPGHAKGFSKRASTGVMLALYQSHLTQLVIEQSFQTETGRLGVRLQRMMGIMDRTLSDALPNAVKQYLWQLHLHTNRQLILPCSAGWLGTA